MSKTNFTRKYKESNHLTPQDIVNQTQRCMAGSFLSKVNTRTNTVITNIVNNVRIIPGLTSVKPNVRKYISIKNTTNLKANSIIVLTIISPPTPNLLCSYLSLR